MAPSANQGMTERASANHSSTSKYRVETSVFFVNENTTEPEKPTMAFAQIYLTQLRKFCDEEEHAVKAEKLKSNGKIYGEPNSYKMVSQSQIESCLERVQASV